MAVALEFIDFIVPIAVIKDKCLAAGNNASRTTRL